MNREEAIQKAERALIDPIAKGGGVALLELDHLRVLLEALRGKGAAICSQWVKTTDRLPTKEDADNTMCWVLATTISSNLPMPEAIAYIRENPDRYPYWMPIPPLPDAGKMDPNGDKGAQE